VCSPAFVTCLDSKLENILNAMSLRSLLFSSDQETLHLVSQALRDLGLEVESCPEIFSAIEKLTTKLFDLVVADLDDGAEAAFLLKTCQELNSTRSALSVAIAGVGVSAAQPGVGLVLNKPLIQEKIKWSLSHCDQLAARLSKSTKAEVLPVQSTPKKALTLPKKTIAFRKEPIQPQPVLDPPVRQANTFANPDLELERGLVPLAESANNKFRGDSHVASMTAHAKSPGFLEEQNPSHVRASHASRNGSFVRVYRPLIMGAAMLGLAYVGVQPARSAALVSSVALIYTKAVENTQSWLQAKNTDDVIEEAQLEVPTRRQRSTRSRVEVIHLEPIAPAITTSPLPEEENTPADGSESAIPSSLRSSFQAASEDNAPAAVEAKLAPASIMSGMQPVLVSEELSRSMVVDKVQPDYPKQALSSGLQGPVVLQALIGKDGKVTELKLVRGYMALGKAASDAVKLWHFRPYVLNGHAVDAQIYITVDFKPPNS
jgi:TonB family protein